MSQQKRETRSEVPPFSGHSLLYTIYRHHHGLPHEQAVLRIDAAIQRSIATYSHEDPPHTA